MSTIAKPTVSAISTTPFRVVFVQKFVPHYRLPFFERFRAELAQRGIELVLLHGQPDPFEGSKVKVAYPPWGLRVVNRIITIKGRHLYWQHAWRHVRRGDLVIAEHAAKLLDNYLLYALSRIGYLHFSYFGHGENFLAGNELGVSRYVKKVMLSRVARWFAYTDVSRRSLVGQGVNEDIISVVNNTLEAPVEEPLPTSKQPNDFLYIGGLYADKRIDFLLESAALIADRSPDFKLHVVGDGPLRSMIEEAARTSPWLHYHGSLYGAERDRLLAACAGILMPGAVGLVAIDSFHFSCPIITIASKAHGPEIAYLEHGHNALIDDEQADAQSFAALVQQLIDDPEHARSLQLACEGSGQHYTLDAMVARFCDGVERVRQTS